MKISIITPVLNGGPLLAQCIESVLREADACRSAGLGITVEHIIADGGSTDGSIALARSYGVVVVQENTSLSERLNRYYFASKGELISFLGADDILLPGALSAVVAEYRRSGRRWVVGGLHWIDPVGRSLGKVTAPPGWLTPQLHACLGWNLGSLMATYISRDFFEELGGFDMTYNIAGDYELFTRALSCAPYARVSQPIAGSRRSGNNMSVVNGCQRALETARILNLHGPKRPISKCMLRVFMKMWVNMRHPDWATHKFIDRMQIRLGRKTLAYFD